MTTLTYPLPFALPRLPELLPWQRQRTELRIDVDLRPEELHADLSDLQKRLNTPGSALYGEKDTALFGHRARHRARRQLAHPSAAAG